MKRAAAWLLPLFVLCLIGCGASQSAETAPHKTETPPKQEIEAPESELREEQEMADRIKFTVGEQSFFAHPAENASADELMELLKEGAVTMSASNYGGFEKVCALGTNLTAHDVQTTTQVGDIMLYNGDQVVIFYGSNSWAYTRLAWVAEEDIPNLQSILSGGETEVLMELA